MNIKNPYTEYASRPRRLNGGLSRIRKDWVQFENLVLNRNSVFDLVRPAAFGLLDDLIPGAEITNRFLEDFPKLPLAEDILEDIETNNDLAVWFYYPRKNHLVRYISESWHRLSLLVRNSTLLQEPQRMRSWSEHRMMFEGWVIAVAGCSVGNNIAHAIVRDLRPKFIKIADAKDFYLHNANRVQLSYDQFGRNKAVVTAEQIHSIDPFINISVYEEGIHRENLTDFISGNRYINELPADFIVEETDDPDAKIMIREEARKMQAPLLMVTDLGSAVQIDLRRFDRFPNIALAPLISDADLYAKRATWERDKADREKFFDFAHALIGNHYKNLPELREIIEKEKPPMFAGVPQLGSTAMAAGGIAAEIVARALLGYSLPERMLINKFTGETITEGNRL